MVQPATIGDQTETFQRKNQMEQTMYRNTTVGSLPLGLSRRLLATFSAFLIGLCALALLGAPSLHAQVAGEGEISGVVTDKSGAVIQHAKITATNIDTGVQTTR
jgi:hypothetical protein